MRIEGLDLEIPPELIAQHPTEPRDACRLLHLDREGGRIGHRQFRQIPQLLREGDVLVLNDSRVLPARLIGRKPTGGRVELLFLSPFTGPGGEAPSGSQWEALARPSSRLRAGRELAVGSDLDEAILLDRYLGEGRWVVGPAGLLTIPEILERQGKTPFPPYITEGPGDPELYQTVYAREPGSAAAPTAGLHFTPGLLSDLRAGGVETASVTLHVGLDTFRPIQVEEVEAHPIHREWYSVPEEALRTLNQARRENRRLVAVGTTSVRVLETLFRDASPGEPASADPRGWTQLYITPGYRFRAVGALLTNFHLPRTSLLALVMAFAGVDFTRRAYAEAVAEHYRFFSFGDAMLVT